MKIMIIGAAHGGQAAVTAAQAQYPTAEISWIEQQAMTHLMGWSATKLATYQAELKRQHVTLIDQTQVVKLQPSQHQVNVRNLATGQSQTLTYDKLILSVGATARQLPVVGKDLTGVVGLRSQADMHWLREQATNPAVQNVVVVGAGYIGIGAVGILSAAGKNVTLVDVNDRVLSSYLDIELTEPLMTTLQAENVTLALPAQVTALTGDATDHVTAVQTDQGSYPADLVVVSVGAQPNTAWLADTLALLPNGSVQTDAYLQTSQPDIWAIGDAVQVQYGPTDQRLNVALASNARRQARWAVQNLITPTKKMGAVQGTSTLKLGDYYFASTGLNSTTAARCGVDLASVVVTQPVTMREATPVTTKLFYQPKTGKLLGAQLLSKMDITASINVVALAMQAQFTVDQLADADFFFQPLFTTATHFLTAAALAAQQARVVVTN